jgi:hypothetical protein
MIKPTNFRTPGAMIGVCLGLIALATLAYFFIPFLPEMPPYLADARLFATGGLLPQNYMTPVGYPLLISSFVKIADIDGVILFQSLVYVVAVISAWLILFYPQRRNGVEKKEEPWPVFLFVLIAFHPYMLLNTHRINDNALNALLMIILAKWCAENFTLRNPGWGLIYGATIGALTSIRPNAAVLVVLPLFALLSDEEPQKRNRLILHQSAFFLAGIAVYAAISFLATGRPWFWPSNGAYNFFAGNNPYSFRYLLEYSNAEQSLRPALDQLGIGQGVDVHDIDHRLYMQLAWQYIDHHVLGFLSLVLIKFWVFFSPRTLHSQSIAYAAVQVILSLPVVIWAYGLVCLGRQRGWRSCWTRIGFVSLYIFPFLVTNSDSRFRMPLDIWFLLDTALTLQRLGYRRWRKSS